MKKFFLLILLLFIFFHLLNAQDSNGKRKGFDNSKIFFSGNFGFTSGSNTLLSISPQIGYRFKKYFVAGTGINFQYLSQKQNDSSGNIQSKTSQDIIGLNIFGRVYPFRFMMLQIQPELNYMFGKIKYYNPALTTNLNASLVPSILLGGGAVIPVGKESFTASVFYDVLQDANSLYSNQPFFNFEYNFRL